jgi:hypothetical protein
MRKWDRIANGKPDYDVWDDFGKNWVIAISIGTLIFCVLMSMRDQIVRMIIGN